MDTLIIGWTQRLEVLNYLELYAFFFLPNLMDEKEMSLIVYRLTSDIN
jgi:hypothetical protein